MAVADTTLRERKRRRTRQEISDVATRLFFERGFEEVTLAQVAEAAEVSVKTIFNHFGSKEDLYFDRAEEVWAALVATIVGRPAGTTILGALHELMSRNRVPFPGAGWDGLADPAGYADFARFLATQDRSPALRARRLTLGEELGRALAGVLVAELGREAGDPAVEALADMIVAANHLRDRALRSAMAEGVPAAEVRERVTRVVDETYGRLAVAFGDIDVAR